MASPRPTSVRRLLHRAGRRRSFGRPGNRPPVDWRVPQDGRAPRLGARELIGHDLRGHGAWHGRNPMVTPRWWRAPRWAALLGTATLTAATGYASWRRHGGREFLFGRDRDED